MSERTDEERWAAVEEAIELLHEDDVDGAVEALRAVLLADAGNVRELENAVERAVAMAREEWISPEDLPSSLQHPAPVDILAAAAEREMTLDELTMAYVRRVLERTGNNKKRTARLLGVDRRTIQRWLGEAQGGDDDEDRKGGST